MLRCKTSSETCQFNFPKLYPILYIYTHTHTHYTKKKCQFYQSSNLTIHKSPALLLNWQNLSVICLSCPKPWFNIQAVPLLCKLEQYLPCKFCWLHLWWQYLPSKHLFDEEDITLARNSTNFESAYCNKCNQPQAFFCIDLAHIYIYMYVCVCVCKWDSKVGDLSRGWPKGSLFNSYYNEV